jgi:ABC-type lipoprotein release transport system permease subunit
MLNNENRYLFKFAWKSIQRNAGRSFFISFSVALAVVIAIWVTAFFEGMNTQIEQAVVNTNMGHFQIQDPVYARTTDSSSPLQWSPGLERGLKEPFIKAASPELVLDANISTPEGAAALTVLGIVPDLHANFLPIKENIVEGEFTQDGDDFSVVIGQELATLFKFKVGDQLVINYQDIMGELRSELLNIKGIYNYNSKGFEKKFVYINQKSWQKLFFSAYTGKILFNRIALMATSLKEEPVLQKRFEGTELKIKTWKNLNPEMAVVLDFHSGMINFFYLIIGITITMTILTPVRMLWQERLSELRMMTVIGISQKKLWKFGLFEVLQMILFSAALSIFLAVTIIGTQSYTGIDFRYLSDGVAIERAGINLPGIIYPQLSFNHLIVIFVFVVFVLSVSYLWSIHSTLKKLEAEL